MKICDTHWEKVKQAVKDSGMWSLVAQSQEEAYIKLRERQEGMGFEPLLEITEYFTTQAIQNGGVDVLEVDEDLYPENEGHQCPVCLFVQHAKDYDLDKHLNETAEDMAAFCRKNGFLKVS